MHIPLLNCLIATISLDGIDLPKLCRVDWDNSPIGAWRKLVPAPDFVWTSESLRVLTIAGDNLPWTLGRAHNVSEVFLPKVHTLRLRFMLRYGLPGLANAQICLPSLRRLILDCIPDNFPALAESFCGPQIQILEIGRHFRFLTVDRITPLLDLCTNVEVLLLPVFFAKLLRPNRDQVENYLSLRHVVLHATKNLIARDEATIWTQISGHFLTFCGVDSQFTSVQVIELYGDEWTPILQDGRFEPMKQVAKSQGVSIVRSDGEIVS